MASRGGKASKAEVDRVLAALAAVGGLRAGNKPPPPGWSVATARRLGMSEARMLEVGREGVRRLRAESERLGGEADALRAQVEMMEAGSVVVGEDGESRRG